MIEKNTIQRMLEFFFTHPSREIHLRELSRELKLSMPAILASSKKLEDCGLISRKKTRAFTIVKANHENAYFVRLKRVYNLQSLYDSGLVDFLSSESKNPMCISCFGSYSRGEDTEISDIDIAIIGASEAEIILDKFEKKLKRKISLHYIIPGKISQEFKSNLCNGITLEGAL